MKKVILTGCAGFIGFHTATELLKRGVTVVGIDNINKYYSPKLKNDRLEQLSKNKYFTFIKSNIEDQTVIYDLINVHKDADAICHLAAQAGVRYSLENPLAYIDSNVRGTTVIFEASKLAGISNIVYASSSSVYGKSTENIFIESQRTDSPMSLYAATKKATEVIAHSYHHLFGIHSTGLRFFTVYGPWGRPDMFAFLLCKSILEKQPIKVFNEGMMYRDFTYVEDIVNGIILSLEKPHKFEIFNLGGAQTTLLNDFIQIVEKEMGGKAPKEYLPIQPGDVERTAADVNHAKSVLGWKPKVSLEEGIANFCKWFKVYYPILKKENDI